MTEKEAEKEAILRAREARFRSRSESEKKIARLMQLKFQMEAYLEKPDSSTGQKFSEFLKVYVDTLYDKRKHFASDLSIAPIELSQVLNQHRAPQDAFLRRLVIHSRASYKHIGPFDPDVWPRIYYQDKVSQFLFTQEQVKESEAKYVTPRKID